MNFVRCSGLFDKKESPYLLLKATAKIEKHIK